MLVIALGDILRRRFIIVVDIVSFSTQTGYILRHVSNNFWYLLQVFSYSFFSSFSFAFFSSFSIEESRRRAFGDYLGVSFVTVQL
jgi:hypothetical protein